MTTDPDISKLDARHAAVAGSRTFRRIVDVLGLGTRATLDAGCGYGEYLVHFGEGSVGLTTTADEVAYGAARGIDIRAGNAEALDTSMGTFEAIWANNLLEHLLSPHAFLMRVRSVAAPGALLVLGVPVVPSIPSLMRLTRWRGALATNHIGFFTRHTLRLTVERAGWTVRDIRPFVFGNVFLDRLVAPLTPHVYVIAERNEGFRYAEKKRKEWEGQAYYAWLLDMDV